MRVSEARQKFCHMCLASDAIVRCITAECMAWRVHTKAGQEHWQAATSPVHPGWEVVTDAPLRVGYVRVRATEDHGECHALPARPE